MPIIKLTKIVNNKIHFNEISDNGSVLVSDYWNIEDGKRIINQDRNNEIIMTVMEFLLVCSESYMMTKSYGSYCIKGSNEDNEITLILSTPHGKKLQPPKILIIK